MNTETITWVELKRYWLDIQASRVPDPSGIRNQAVSFVGADDETVKGWVERGYDLPGFSGGAVTFVPRKRRRAQWNAEQGRIDVTRALCGDENYRLTRAPREYRHGSTVEIGYGFRANVRPEVIGQYGKVCAGIIRKLEAEGLDVKVDIVSRSIPYIIGVPGKCELHVRVKDVNERADFRSWSAIFSPAGHRALMFTGRCIHAARAGGRIHSGKGGSLHNAWKIERDGDVIRIDCHSTDNRNPTETLEQQAREAGIL